MSPRPAIAGSTENAEHTPPVDSSAQTDTVEAGVRRRELAAFLRSRRERITPEQVGLPRGRRRRTPGLRREEVAQLSAVGVTWYTWLEQARDIHVSEQVLDALARALKLDRSERAHLFALAERGDPVPTAEATEMPRAVRAMVRRLSPYPACVQNSRYDVLHYNPVYGRLLCDMDQVPREDRNCIWLAFHHPQWRERIVDWEDTVRLMAAKYRSAMAEHLTDPAWKAMLARLEGSAEFRQLWERHEVVRGGTPHKHFLHPEVGTLRVEHTSMWLADRPGVRLVTYVPLDEASEAALTRLNDLVEQGG
ncbi:helix-turn-helix transcriptional regulator [Streptomyces sp. NPDC005438]|uniref:helix-turn-helix transcriptional regulator n=1 Tax=Streptomyces sp. NPDC005438 TaxID=3156880 RepID=UPI0033B99ECA